MRKPVYILLALMILTSCSKQQKHSTFITNTEITKSFTSGKWQIFSEDKNIDTTYNGYEFSFNSDNSMLINKGQDIYYGKWMVYNDYGTDDAPPSDIDFEFIFASPTPLKLTILNGNYHIIKRTKNELELLSVNTSHPEKIVFKKI